MRRVGGEPKAEMRKLYNEMIQEKAGIKGEALVQIGGIKKKDKEMAMAE